MSQGGWIAEGAETGTKFEVDLKENVPNLHKNF
jgi:hypothetical protein